MTENIRKPIPKKLRFDVFKRDSFTCQYCGRMAPDVVLEIDHIHPVAAGGKNDIMNLVTSCKDCNSGKGARALDDSSAVKKQQRQLIEINERREQLKMMLEWKAAMAETVEIQIDAICALVNKAYDCTLNAYARGLIKSVIKRFGFSESYEAAEISLDRYNNIDVVIHKLGGICYNRLHNIRGR